MSCKTYNRHEMQTTKMFSDLLYLVYIVLPKTKFYRVNKMFRMMESTGGIQCIFILMQAFVIGYLYSPQSYPCTLHTTKSHTMNRIPSLVKWQHVLCFIFLFFISCTNMSFLLFPFIRDSSLNTTFYTVYTNVLSGRINRSYV